MYPSLPAKATFWVKRRPFFALSGIKRGEIVVFYQEKDGKVYDFVWRVTGLPGDHVEIRGTDVLINGKLLLHETKEETSEHIIFTEMNDSRKYLVAYDKVHKSDRRIDLLITVPEAHLFLLGDNRDNAYDSRFNGTVAFKYITGKKF
jgi:signal peptidase I